VSTAVLAQGVLRLLSSPAEGSASQPLQTTVAISDLCAATESSAEAAVANAASRWSSLVTGELSAPDIEKAINAASEGGDANVFEETVVMNFGTAHEGRHEKP